MRKRIAVESGRDRRALVADAGLKQLSFVSLLAGVLVAYGAFAVLAGIAGGILEAVEADTDITARWDDLGVAAGLVVAGLLFLSYLFGGYVAGRMARRAGIVHGVATFLLGVLLVAVVAVVIRAAAGTDGVVENLRDLGLPTTGDEWRDVGTVAGLASLAAMLVGAVIGGILGERWHAKLLSRAVDPDVGAEADARRRSAEAAVQADARNTESQTRVDNASLRHRRGADVDRDVDNDRTLVRDRDDDVRVRDDVRDRDRDGDRLADWPDDGTGARTRASTRARTAPTADDEDDVVADSDRTRTEGNGWYNPR